MLRTVFGDDDEDFILVLGTVQVSAWKMTNNLADFAGDADRDLDELRTDT